MTWHARCSTFRVLTCLSIYGMEWTFHLKRCNERACFWNKEEPIQQTNTTNFATNNLSLCFMSYVLSSQITDDINQPPLSFKCLNAGKKKTNNFQQISSSRLPHKQNSACLPRYQEEVEILMIRPAYRVAQPWTMVIHTEHLKKILAPSWKKTCSCSKVEVSKIQKKIPDN